MPDRRVSNLCPLNWLRTERKYIIKGAEYDENVDGKKLIVRTIKQCWWRAPKERKKKKKKERTNYYFYYVYNYYFQHLELSFPLCIERIPPASELGKSKTPQIFLENISTERQERIFVCWHTFTLIHVVTFTYRIPHNPPILRRRKNERETSGLMPFCLNIYNTRFTRIILNMFLLRWRAPLCLHYGCC